MPTYDRLAEETNIFLDQLPPYLRTVIEPLSDSYLAAQLHNQAFNRPPLHFGKVVMSLPYLNWYRVLLDDGEADLPCCKLGGGGSFMPIGVRETSPIPPNASVWVLKPPGAIYGFIVGIVPEIMTDPRLVFPDWIVQGGQSGFKRESYYTELLRLTQGSAGAIDFSCSRPLDATSLGEWGMFSEMGNGFFTDSFLTYTRVDEETGLFLYVLDQIAKLTGHSLELNSYYQQQSFKDDEGESRGYRGEAIYPWEALGQFTNSGGALPYRQNDATAVQYSSPYSAVEPRYDDQQPVHRRRDWSGYLGQGGKRTLSIPPTNRSDLNRYGSKQADGIGVFEEIIGLDGDYGLRSAKGITLAKYALIPAPKELALPEDGTGDDAAAKNYNFSGASGYGVPHKVGDVQRGSDAPGMQSLAGLLDLHANLFNWKGNHPFYYHTKDFLLPEESAATSQLNQAQQTPAFSKLQSQMWLDPPTPAKLRVDHRNTQCSYYEVLSYVSLLDDGGVAIGGGQGEEIRLAGGSIFLQCPGDIFLQPGRNVVALGGDDVILRAKNSLDLSAGNHDVRIKAERNMQFLAGNGSVGGMLFESKGPGPIMDFDGNIGEDVISSGIVFKSAASPFVVWANGVYLRTGSAAGGVIPGDIVLDADQGNANIIQLCNTAFRYIETAAYDTWGVETPRATNLFSDVNSIVASALSVGGVLSVIPEEGPSGIICDGNVAIINGHVSSDMSSQYQGKVGDLLQGGAIAEVEASIAIDAENVQQVDQTGEQTLTQIQEEYYQEGQIGNTDTQSQAAFSFRNETQYGTQDFLLAEARWQQLGRISGSVTTTWSEPSVTYQGQQLSPYPGEQAWKQQSSLRQLDPQLFDVKKGLAKDRAGGTYENPSLASWTTIVPHGNYLTIR